MFCFVAKLFVTGRLSDDSNDGIVAGSCLKFPENPSFCWYSLDEYYFEKFFAQTYEQTPQSSCLENIV